MENLHLKVHSLKSNGTSNNGKNNNGKSNNENLNNGKFNNGKSNNGKHNKQEVQRNLENRNNLVVKVQNLKENPNLKQKGSKQYEMNQTES